MNQSSHEEDLCNKQTDAQQEFCYNDSAEKYIGKHTGKLFGRVNPKSNFDGFTRFSEYESRRDTELLALANESESSFSKRESNLNHSNVAQNFGRNQPFPSRESPIIKPSLIEKVPSFQLNETERKQKASVKRTSSSMTPSKMKTYKDLLSDLNDEEFKSFIFNQEQIKEIKSLSQQEKQLNPQKEKIKSFQTKQQKPQFFETAGGQQKRQTLSYKPKDQTNNTIKIERQNHFEMEKLKSEEKKGRKNQSSSKKIVEGRRMKTRSSHILQFCEEQEQDKQEIGNENKTGQLPYAQQNEPEYHNDNQDRYPQILQNSPVNQCFNEQQEYVQEEKENQKSFRFIDVQEPQMSLSKNQTKFEEQKGKILPNKRQRKHMKEPRIIGSPINHIQQTRQQFSIKQSAKKVYSKTQTKHHRKRSAFGNPKKYMKIKSQQEVYLERLGDNNQEESNNKRYPHRTRIKPVHFWENEKVHYKAGRATWIERANLNFGDLLQTNNKYDNLININFHNHQIGIEMVIPPMKTFTSGGIKHPHQSLHISLSDKVKDFGQFSVIFDDGIRSEKVKQNETFEVPQNMKFELKNQSKLPAIIQLKIVS